MLGSFPMRPSKIRRWPWRRSSSTQTAAVARLRHRSSTTFWRRTSASKKSETRAVMLRIDRRLIAHFEWPLLVITLAIVVFGLFTILSATYSPNRLTSPYVIRQAIWAAAGLTAMIAALSFDYRLLD